MHSGGNPGFRRAFLMRLPLWETAPAPPAPPRAQTPLRVGQEGATFCAAPRCAHGLRQGICGASGLPLRLRAAQIVAGEAPRPALLPRGAPAMQLAHRLRPPPCQMRVGRGSASGYLGRLRSGQAGGFLLAGARPALSRRAAWEGERKGCCSDQGCRRVREEDLRGSTAEPRRCAGAARFSISSFRVRSPPGAVLPCARSGGRGRASASLRWPAAPRSLVPPCPVWISGYRARD